MRTLKLAVCVLLLALCSSGQGRGQKADSSEGKLLALEKMWNQAQLLRDSGALESLIGESFVNTEWDGGVTNREQFLADIRDPRFKPTAMSIEDVRVNLYGDTAIVFGFYHTKGSYRGRPYDHLGRFTDTWIFQNRNWQCVASHTSLVKK